MRALPSATPSLPSTLQHHGPFKNSIPTLNSKTKWYSTISPASLNRRPHLRVQSQRPPEQDARGGDTDEAFDDSFFKKYGEVVFTRGDRKPSSAEADDDAESLSFAVALAKVANEVEAVGSRMRDIAEQQFNRVASGDTKPNSWTLLDFGDVVVHIFLPPQRDYYNLEEFYGNATLVELPFDTQSPNRN